MAFPAGGKAYIEWATQEDLRGFSENGRNPWPDLANIPHLPVIAADACRGEDAGG
jgi:hypothetical protein